MATTRPEPQKSAKKAGLLYVSDEKPGIRRLRSGSGFRYVDAKGRAVRNESVLRRIRRLAIPPAWTDVWICPQTAGHLQATGRDARGRKQFRYHPDWREARDATKYEHVIEFARALPRIRRQVARDLRRSGIGRERVLATIVRLMDLTFVRVGNEEYAKQNGSYGLTTLRDRHAKVRGGKLRFRFRGKSGKQHEIELEDRRLARIVRECQDIPGQVLFQYYDEAGEPREVSSNDVNEYLRAAAGDDFTARDFRTWAGTVLAMRELQGLAFATATDAKRNVVRAVERVAAELGNTVSVCRKCYIHPSVLERYADGALPGVVAAPAVATRSGGTKGDRDASADAATRPRRGSAATGHGRPAKASKRSAAAHGKTESNGRVVRPRRATSLDADEKQVLRFLQCCRRETKRVRKRAA
jgi:DNA topoisomerase-1